MRKYLISSRLALAGCLAFSTVLLSPLIGTSLASAAPQVQRVPHTNSVASLTAAPLSATNAITPTAHLPVVQRGYPYQSTFGVGVDSVTTSGGLNQLVSSKSTWTRRFGVYWSKVEPTKGARNWSALASFEQELLNAASNNIKVVLIVGSTPTWAQAASGRYCGPVKSSELAAFGSFIRDAVARYSNHPYNVQYWELWNEPDVGTFDVDPTSEFGCWGDSSDPYFGGGGYAAMLQAAYPQMKAANPSVQVMIGGLLLDCDPRKAPPSGKSCAPSKFLEGILRAGGGNSFDGVSFHAYDFYDNALGQYNNQKNWGSSWNTIGPTFIAKAGFLRQVLNSYSVTGKFLMNTELALIIWGGTGGDPTFEETKAYYVAQAYAAAIAEGLRGNLWYSMNGWFGSELLSNGSPLKAFNAYSFASSKLGASTFIGNISSGDLGGASGVKGYKFDRGDRKIWLIWSADGSNHSVNLSGTPVGVYDPFGNAGSANTVGIKPLYVEWNP